MKHTLVIYFFWLFEWTTFFICLCYAYLFLVRLPYLAKYFLQYCFPFAYKFFPLTISNHVKFLFVLTWLFRSAWKPLRELIRTSPCVYILGHFSFSLCLSLCFLTYFVLSYHNYNGSTTCSPLEEREFLIIHLSMVSPAIFTKLCSVVISLHFSVLF